jgi:hypothetical protein
MGVLARRASDVRINEVDLSTVITNTANAVAALVATSSKGPVGPTFYSSADDFLADFGNPNAAVSFDHYAALDYFKEGNALWVTRALGTGFRYSAAVVKLSSLQNTQIAGIVGGVADPLVPDFPAYVLSNETPVLAITASQGPGSYGNNIAVAIRSQNLEPPSTVTATSSATGGSLVASTYQYAVSAISPQGETLATAPVSIIVAAATTTNAVTVSWNAVPGALGYHVYGRVGSGMGRIGTVGAGSLEFVDSGIVPPSSSQPLTSPAQLATQSNRFTLEVYDLALSGTTPQETFVCSLTEEVDEVGSQLEVEQRVNPFSRYIRVESNVAALLTVPVLRSVATPVPLTGGASGSPPTASDINSAWNRFLDKELYKIDVLINAGKTNISIQQRMDLVAQTRNDCVAFLDTPSAKQTAQRAVDFRNLELNLNSSYSALFCPDLKEQDPINGKILFVPPSGAMAGLMARTTRVSQPWFSIAGLNRGLLNVLDVRNTYDDGQATLMYQAQVNYMRKFIGRGIPLWEQSTLYNRNSALQFLNVRVLCNVIKRATYDYLIYGLQEPGDDILRKQLQFALEDYLRFVQAGRGIRNFRVQINDKNNPPALVNSGILAVAIVITPILAVREIQLTLVISKTGLELSEAEIAAVS